MHAVFVSGRLYHVLSEAAGFLRDAGVEDEAADLNSLHPGGL